MPDLMNAAVETSPLKFGRDINCAQFSRSSWPQRHGPKSVLDVGKDQLLVLLLVLQPKVCQRAYIFWSALQKTFHVPIDVVAVRAYLFEAGPRHQATRTTIRMRAKLLVIRIEQKFV